MSYVEAQIISPDAADGHFSAQTGGSSNGRTTVSGSVYRG